MSTIPARPLAEPDRLRSAACDTRNARHLLRLLLEALLTRRATRLWWVASAGIVLITLILHGSAWLGIPTIATADTNAYGEVLHTLESGQWPDLRDRNLGYPLFMYACKLLPLSLNQALPLVQHLLELTAGVIVMVWMRRNWGVLAGLMTGALLLVNAGRVIWTHYGHPNALLCSVVPLALLATMGWLAVRRRWCLPVATLLWLIVVVTRDEVMILAAVIPFVPFCFYQARRRRCFKWYAVVLAIAAVGGAIRLGINYQATGALTYSTKGTDIIAWRGLHADELVAPPRPQRLERLYEAALANGATWRGGHLHYEDLWRAGRDKWGMTQHEAIFYMVECAVECIRQRPGTYAKVVLRDIPRLWLYPHPNLEWAAFEKADPEKFHRAAARLTWAEHNRAEFPISYESSAPQRLFATMAVLRPGANFAMKPLIALFLVGLTCLLFGVGSRGQTFRRWWFVGLAVGVIALTIFYAAVCDVPNRYRLTVEWAFFAVASLGLILPLRALRRHNLWSSPLR